MFIYIFIIAISISVSWQAGRQSPSIRFSIELR